MSENMKGKLVSSNFKSFILVVFFLMLALKNSLAHAHQAVAADGGAVYMKENHVSAPKEEFVDLNSDITKVKKAIRGRKMIIRHEVQDGDNELVMKTRSRREMLSGTEDSDALKNSHRSLDGTHNQVEGESRDLQSSKQIIPSQPKKLVTQDQAAKAREDESERAVEGAKEMMKLMNKDYGGRMRPRRKPPIHNRGSKD